MSQLSAITAGLLRSICCRSFILHCEVFTQKRPESFVSENREREGERDVLLGGQSGEDVKIFTESLQTVKTLRMINSPTRPHWTDITVFTLRNS